MSTVKKVLIAIGVIFVGLMIYSVIDLIVIETSNSTLKYNKSISSNDLITTSDYYQYLESHPSNYPENELITIDGIDYLEEYTKGDYSPLVNYNEKNYSLYTGEESSITYQVDVVHEGFYNIYIHYYPHQGKSSDIERRISINGEVPFDGASVITLKRIWGSEEKIIEDIFGNDIRPSQVERPRWMGSYFKDTVGYIGDPYLFYFNTGLNTITLDSLREPLVIASLELRSIVKTKAYSEVLSEYQTLGYQSVDNVLEIKQTEDPLYTTSPTLYPLNDRTSPLTMPNSPSLIKLNSIGGTNWRGVGDFITWEFSVPKTGLYAISLRVKQNLAGGMTSNRDIYLDNEIPFAEMKGYSFIHSQDWRIQTLGTLNEPYLFYLTAGKHELKLETVLGEYGPISERLETTIDALNRLYREIIAYTGPEPDPYRDYDLFTRIPDLLERINQSKVALEETRAKIIEYAGKSEKTGIIDTFVKQLDDFLRKPREIHRKLSPFSNNIAALGTLWIMISEQPLELDYFVVHTPNTKLPRPRANQFQSFWYNLSAFFATFTTDYSKIGMQNVGDADETIDVWMTTGKDQINVLRKLIDESFSPNSKIRVNLQLVASTALLPATLSKKGPDVALSLDLATPVNYALRNASYDLSTFPDFSEISKRFFASAMVPYELNGGYYALPEQQIFLMMFYRTDIFEELNLPIPSTWDDIIAMIPSLQKHNLEFYMPIPITQGQTVSLAPNPIFSTMFYQNDGEFYLNNNRESGFATGIGPRVFETWTQFYTDYSFPVEANFVNRFRSGQMPIGITYYNIYNTLSVFAPEIRGKWNFLPVPGTKYLDEFGVEQIRRETVATGTSSMILKQTDSPNASWEFLKWWSSTETQVRFGREMEGILGAAARYPTANVEALGQLPWTTNEYKMLLEQWQWVRGIPEVPGGYMTGRYLDNAFRLVYNEAANPKETIYDYVQLINAEIKAKREEFGLE